jgi:hypothetical protein
MRGIAWLPACLAVPLCSASTPAEPRPEAEISTAIVLQTSPLAGFQYHAGQALFPLMATGDRLSLRREPDNPHDDKAVRVEWRGAMIGFAPRADNSDLARLMDRGARVEGRIVHLQKGRDPWRRVLIEVLLLEAGP